MSATTDDSRAAPGLLPAYLASRDKPRPRCEYDLRSLRGDQCPECGKALRLTVGLVEPRIAAYINAVVAAALGPGGSGMFLMVAFAAATWNGWSRGAATMLLALMVVPSPTLVLILAGRRECYPPGEGGWAMATVHAGVSGSRFPEFAMLISHHSSRFVIAAGLGVLLLLGAGGVWGDAATRAEAADDRPHVIIETDLGGDPDDEASMVRFLLYACDFHVDGIILTNAETRHGISGRALFERYLKAYGEVLPTLLKHDANYPTVEELRAVTMTAYKEPGRESKQDPAGAKRLLELSRKDLPYRTWYLNWGTASSMRLAFKEVEGQGGVEALTTFCRAFHISSLSHGTPGISTRDKFAREQMREAQRESGIISVDHSWGGDKMFSKWYHQMGLITTAADTSVKEDITTGHGPLGALYTTQKEGDTATFLYLIPNGLNDFTRPDQGNWAGRYGRVTDSEHVKDTLYYWPNQEDDWQGETSWQNTRKRWGDAAQSDFLCRLDWCVMGYEQANHPPVVIVEGDATIDVLQRDVTPGARVELSAAGSTDPDDGDTLRYQWFHYPEAGAGRSEIGVADSDSERVVVEVPRDTETGDTFHVVLAVHDDGSRKGNGVRDLTRYRRVVLRVVDPK